MPKYNEFWRDLLNEISQEFSDGTQPYKKVISDSGINTIGNRTSGWNGSLEAFAFDIKRFNNTQVFRDLHNALKKHKLFKSLSGQFDVTLRHNHEVTFIYVPFSWELLMNRYREHQDKTRMEAELDKWRWVQGFQSRWGKYENRELDFKSFWSGINWGNMNYYTANQVWQVLAESMPAEFEGAVNNFFDEEKPLQKRIDAFKNRCIDLYKSLPDSRPPSHGQEERAFATLLTFRYPEKYTFYMDSYYQPLVRCLGKKPKPAWNKLSHYFEITEQFRTDVLPDFEDVISIKNDVTRGPEFYRDDNHQLLIQDIFYITLNPNSSSTETNQSEMKEVSKDCKYWLYAPGANASKWEEFRDNGMMALGWEELGDLNQYNSKKTIAERLQELERTTGSKKNDATANWEFKNVMQPGDIVIAKKGKKEFLGYGIVTSDYYYDTSRKRFKSCRKVNWIKSGSWNDDDHDIVTKTLTDITKYPEYLDRLKKLIGIGEDSIIQRAKREHPENQILYGPPGTGKTYRLKNEYFEKYTTQETSISPEQHFEDVAADLSWWQVSALALLELKEAKVADIKQNRWIQHKVGHSASKNLNATIWGTLQTHALEESETVSYKQRQPPLFFDKSEGSRWRILEDQVKEQAPELLEILDSVNNFKPNPDKSIERFVFTTFHQSYSYEDFLEGIKPVMEDESEGNITYRIEPGIFKKLCERAAKDPDNRYAIFIDEINRGNIANIFGELITLIEPDKRTGGENPMTATLPYSKTKFSVPSNVDIYGTMNTADRSVESLDTALRRRFSFKEMMPNPKLIIDVLEGVEIWKGISLSEVLKTINNRIEVLVDRDHTIGHSYFLDLKDTEDFEVELKCVFTDKIIPLLQEYFYNDYVKIGMVLGNGFVKSEKEAVKFADFEETLAADYENGVRAKLVSPDDFELEKALKLLLNLEKEIPEDAES